MLSQNPSAVHRFRYAALTRLNEFPFAVTPNRIWERQNQSGRRSLSLESSMEAIGPEPTALIPIRHSSCAARCERNSKLPIFLDRCPWEYDNTGSQQRKLLVLRD
jgi:hypothetical protein